MPLKKQAELFEKLKGRVLASLARNVADAKLIQRCTDLLKQAPNDVATLTLRAIAYRLAGNLEACVRDCNAILQSDPDNRFALFHRASAHTCASLLPSEVGSFVEHLLAAQKHAKTLEDDRFGLFIQVLLIAADTGATDDFLPRLADLVKSNPEDRLALMMLIAVYLVRIEWHDPQEEVDKTIRLAKKLIAMDPHNALAAQVLLGIDGEQKYASYPRPPTVTTRIFTHYPLIEQDETLPAYVAALPFPFTVMPLATSAASFSNGPGEKSFK
jgi:tetratricopeptide (TPR) repeat protein